MNRQVAAFILVVVIAAGVVLGMSHYVRQTRQAVRETQRLTRENEALLAEVAKSHQVQCLQRADLEAETAATEKLLNPTTAEERRDALVVFKALPRRLVVNGQARNATTLENLAILDCKEAP